MPRVAAVFCVRAARRSGAKKNRPHSPTGPGPCVTLGLQPKIRRVTPKRVTPKKVKAWPFPGFRRFPFLDCLTVRRCGGDGRWWWCVAMDGLLMVRSVSEIRYFRMYRQGAAASSPRCHRGIGRTLAAINRHQLRTRILNLLNQSAAPAL